jgi:hypothetical protein
LLHWFHNLLGFLNRLLLARSSFQITFFQIPSQMDFSCSFHQERNILIKLNIIKISLPQFPYLTYLFGIEVEIDLSVLQLGTLQQSDREILAPDLGHYVRLTLTHKTDVRKMEQSTFCVLHVASLF